MKNQKLFVQILCGVLALLMIAGLLSTVLGS